MACCEDTGQCSLCTNQVPQCKGCTYKARLPDAEKLPQKLDKRSFIVDINGRWFGQADKDSKGK